MKKVKITSFYPDRIIPILKRGLVLVTTTAVIFSMTGCGKQVNIQQLNDNSFCVEYGDTTFSTYYSNFFDDDVQLLPDTLEEINLNYCLYLSDLNDLPEVCPHLKRVIIDNCPSIDSLDFLYQLDELEYVSLNDNAFVNQKLIDDLTARGVECDVSKADIEAAEKTDQIITEIITDDMTDEEKIQAITYYVIDNYKYKISKASESNDDPLENMFANEGGVCASYAYLTNVLLRKAGIKSYEIASEAHAWNIIDVDGKYYYLDTTNIKQIPFLSKALVKYFGVGLYYMTDPSADSFSAMEEYDNTEKVIIPSALIEDIKAGESEKNLYEKYGNSVPARVIEILTICLAISGAIKGVKAMNNAKSSKKRRRR